MPFWCWSKLITTSLAQLWDASLYTGILDRDNNSQLWLALDMVVPVNVLVGVHKIDEAPPASSAACEYKG